MTTLQASNQATSPTQTAGRRASPAKTFPLAESTKPGSTERGADCFLKLLGSSRAKLPKIDPDGFCLKMLKTSYQSMEDGILRRFCISYPKLGTTANGSLSIPSHTFPKTESAFSLSDILETDAPEKYFLSDAQTQKLLLNLLGVAKGAGCTRRVVSV